MVALWVIVIILIQAVVLTFAISLCKSAALADRQYDKARQAEQHKRAASAHAVDAGTTISISSETRATAHANAALDIRRR
jgi:hypothetical protein